MPDVDLGTISAQIDIDTSLLNQRTNEVMAAWESIKNGCAQAATGLSEKMVTGLNQYQQKLDIIAQKLERQRQLLKQLEDVSNRPVIGRNSQGEIEKATAQLEKEKIKLQELEAQFDRTYDAQRNFIAQQDKTAKKVEQTAQKMDLREAGANAKIGTDMAATGLRTLDQVAPGLAGNIGNIVTQVNATRMAMQSTGSTPMKWAMGISAAVGIAATLVMAGINQMKEAEEKRQQAFEEGIQNIQTYSENLRTLETNLDKLKNDKSTVEELKDARQALANTSPELISSWDNEGIAVLKNTEKIEENIQAIKEKAYWERQSIIGNSRDIVKSFDQQKSEIEDYSKKIQELSKFIQEHQNELSNGESGEVIAPLPPDLAKWLAGKGFMLGDGALGTGAKSTVDMLQDLEGAYADLNIKQLETESGMKSYFEVLIQDSVSATDKITGLATTYGDFDSAQRAVVKTISSDVMDGILSLSTQGERLDAVSNIVKKIKTTLEDPTAMQQHLKQTEASNRETEKQESLNRILAGSYGAQKAPLSSLTDAYKQLSEGQLLSEASMTQLAQTFPEILDYLQKTKDLTLDSGKVITEVMQGIDFSSQISELGNLAQAYQTVADGQQLSVSQLYEMAQKYPEIAEYLANTGDQALSYGEVLKGVYNIQRDLMIQGAEEKLKNAENQAQITNDIISNIEKRLDAQKLYFQTVKGISGVDFEAENQRTHDEVALEVMAKKNELAEQIQQQADDIEKARAELALLKSSATSIGNISSSSKKSGSSSSSKAPTRNEALAAELKQLEQKKKMDQLTSQQELEWLERIQSQHKMNADEKLDMEYRIYSVKKKLEQEAEQAATERLQAEYKAMENKKSLGALSAKEELAWLERIQQSFRLNKDEQMELEIKLYNLKKQLHEEDVDSLNSIGAAVTEALKNKYKEQQEAEQQRIQDSIKSWQDWEDETVKAIQGQIDALDELEKQQDDEEKRAEYEKKRQATSLQLAYEKDDYNRKQLEKELNRIDEEEKKRLEKLAREEQRKQLQEEIDKTQETSSKQQDSLQEELDALNKQYAELTKDFNLRAEAEKAIMESSQKEIIEMIKSYAPEYDLAGQTIGEKLADGFKKKVGDIAAYMERFTQQVTDYQNRLADTANAAADDFWKAREEYEKRIAVAGAPAQGKSVQINMAVNFNQPVESPIEMKRRMDQVSQELARRIGG